MDSAYDDMPPGMDKLKHMLGDAGRKLEEHLAKGGTEESFRFDSGTFIPWTLGDYEILDEIERGGQATVYYAIQNSTRRTVALKVLEPKHEYSVTRFLDEVDYLGTLSHPNVVGLYDSGQAEGRYYYSMEFIDGVPITEYVEQHAISIEDRVRLFTKLVHALARVHSAGLVHRDLKPSNILVDAKGRPVLVDFGLATAKSKDACLLRTTEGAQLGTVPYMSPEHLAGTADQFESDVYSIGVVFYQVLTGRMPYPVADESEARRSIRSEHPAVPASLPSDIKMIIWKAMEKKIGDRYADAHELAADLDQFLARRPLISARGSSLAYVARKFWERNRRLCLIAAAVFILLSCSTFVSMSMWVRTDRIARSAQAALQMRALVDYSASSRDEGRRENAITGLQQAIDIWRDWPSDSPGVLSHYFEACKTLASIYYDEGDLDEADKLVDEAVRVSAEVCRKLPGDDAWKRHFGHAQTLIGLRFFKQNDYAQALEAYEKSRDTFERLLQSSGVQAVRSNIAYAYRWEGACLLELQRPEAAVKKYKVARELCHTLVKDGIDRLTHSLDAAYCELRLSRCYYRTKSPGSLDLAIEQIRVADQTLAEIKRTMKTSPRSKYFTEVRDSVDRYRDFLLKRKKRESSKGSTT